MILRPLLAVNVRPALFNWIHQTRSLRPTIRIGKERFQVSIDVRQFRREELRVKASPEYVTIEGKQEQKIKNGCIVRKFAKKYKLPEGCDPGSMKTTLSSDGILTVTAPRSTCDREFPCERVLQISYVEPKDENLVTVQAPDKENKP